IADVDRFLVHRPVLARQGRLAYRLGKFGRRHRLPLAAALAVLSVVVTSLAVFFAQAAETRRQRDRAQEVTDFMVSAFQAADPSHSLGAEVTAAQIVEQSLRQLDVQPPVAPETAAELLLAIGQVQANLGLGSDAWSTLQRAEEAYRVAGRDPELETRIAKAQLRARLDEGRAEAARGVANRLLNRDDLTAEDRLYFELGLAASDFQDSHFERARERYEILNRRAQRVGLGETEIGLKVFKGLGRCLEALGELDQALATYETVLETEDRLLPAVHPQRLDTLHAVETVLMRLSQPHETQKVATEILQLTTKLYGGESLPRARALKTLADVASDLGDPEQAAEHMQAALTIYRRRYGETHKDVAGAWFNLALYAYEAPNLAELADRSFASAITVGSDVWPQDHRNLMLFPIAYSLHLNETGRFDETLVQIRRSLAIADARPEYKEYDFYPFGELARAVAELNLSPSPVGKIDVETWLAECATLPKPQRTMAKKQARLVESLGVEVPPEILAAPDP
ncbi:MAG: tetratricopeptide repeat protein, partial [Acidobacteriota bacterium]